jgi:hypothetical protein
MLAPVSIVMGMFELLNLALMYRALGEQFILFNICSDFAAIKGEQLSAVFNLGLSFFDCSYY